MENTILVIALSIIIGGFNFVEIVKIIARFRKFKMYQSLGELSKEKEEADAYQKLADRQLIPILFWILVVIGGDILVYSILTST